MQAELRLSWLSAWLWLADSIFMLSDIDSWSESSFCSESSGKSELEPAETISNKQVKEKGNNNVSKLE